MPIMLFGKNAGGCGTAGLSLVNAPFSAFFSAAFVWDEEPPSIIRHKVYRRGIPSLKEEMRLLKSYNKVFNVFDIVTVEIPTFSKKLTIYFDGVYPLG